MVLCHWHIGLNYRREKLGRVVCISQQARGQRPNTSPICWTTDFSRLQISKLKLSAEVEKFPETKDQTCLLCKNISYQFPKLGRLSDSVDPVPCEGH